MAPDRLLIVTDVDGTLLDEHGRLPCTARVLRAHLAAVQSDRSSTVDVALASSRTLTELVVLQRALGLPGACIAEDGSVVAVDEHSCPSPLLAADAEARSAAHIADSAAPAESQRFVRQYGRRTLHCWGHQRDANDIRALLADIPAVARADARFQSRDELERLGFRTTAAIRRALDHREYTVLLVPERLSAREQVELRAIAEERALEIRRGGRWLTIASHGGKGARIRALRHKNCACGVTRTVVATIGNEENDVSLLRAADRRFVIRNPGRGPHPALAELPGAIVLESVGTGGWLEMLMHLRDLSRDVTS